jgi:predicted DNA-binding transcriptional regulator AlpA
MDTIGGEVTGRVVSVEHMTPLAFTIVEFCHLHRISRATFYNMVKAGVAPRVMVVGGRKLVSAEAAADWRKEREKAA